MAKNTQYAEAVPVAEEYNAYGDAPKPAGPYLGTLRIARVTYDHTPIHTSKNGGTIGQMVDEHIATVIASGGLVSEVALMFETVEQQHELAKLYK
jgi:hypothetical protein